MNHNNVLISAAAMVLMTLAGCLTYFHVVDSNNNKEVVTRAIERGNDPISAACAASLSNSSKDMKTTCEKLALIRDKR